MKQQVVCWGQLVSGSHWILSPSATSCLDIPSSLVGSAGLWVEAAAVEVVVVGRVVKAATFSAMGSGPEGFAGRGQQAQPPDRFLQQLKRSGQLWVESHVAPPSMAACLGAATDVSTQGTE